MEGPSRFNFIETSCPILNDVDKGKPKTRQLSKCLPSKLVMEITCAVWFCLIRQVTQLIYLQSENQSALWCFILLYLSCNLLAQWNSVTQCGLLKIVYSVIYVTQFSAGCFCFLFMCWLSPCRAAHTQTYSTYTNTLTHVCHHAGK